MPHRNEASLGAFVRGPLLHTLEGWVVLAGSVVCVCLAVLAYFAPSFVGVRAGGANAPLFLFGVWPVILVTIYVAVCAPEFHSRVFTFVFLLAAACFPVWLVFRRALAAALGF